MNRERMPKTAEVLTFKASGRVLELERVQNEFQLMREHLKGRELTVEIAERVCSKSGTHLLKMVSPRVDGEHACLYIETSANNSKPKILPSTNAPDIPFCKVLFRPLEIFNHPTASVIDHVMNPEDISSRILKAFAAVFGQEVLDAVRRTLANNTRRVTKLAAGEFPIIYVPREGGGDLQVTPVSPASAYSNMRAATNAFFQKQVPGEPKVPRGKFIRQTISGKPQNISGAIGGTRSRLLAEMPPVLKQNDAEIYRFIRGGGFPRWRDPDVKEWILRYGEMLSTEFNNKNTRNALDRTANRLISDAVDFIEETYINVRLSAEKLGVSCKDMAAQPSVTDVLIRRYWVESEYLKARKALSSSDFQSRVSKLRSTPQETA